MSCQISTWTHTDPTQILSDYDAQITHLRKELEQVHHEYSEWEAASKPSRAS